jgi:chemosensory pili system protein ChpA (sensor histidine kinase/response regulator)
MSSQVRTILASELRELSEEFQRQAPALEESSEEAATHCLGLCQRLGQVANMIEVPALQELALFLVSNVPGLLGRVASLQPLAQLCAELQQCLLEGADSARWVALAANLADARWPAALETDAAEVLAQGLRPLAIDEIEPVGAALAPDVSLNDLTLQSSADVGPEMLQAFFHEAPLQAMQLSGILGKLNDAVVAADIAAAQRLAHTLKGSGALCGLHALTHVAHALEAGLQRLATTDPVSSQLCGRLIEAGDTIEQLIELAASGVPAPQTLPALIARIYADLEDQSLTVSAGAPLLMAAPVSLEIGRSSNTEAAAVNMPSLNVPTALIDDNLRRVGEINVAIDQLSVHITALLARTDRLAEQLTLVQSQVYELETLADTRGIPVVSTQSASGQGFDPLELDSYTALHSLSRTFAESTLDSRELSRELGIEVRKLQNLLTQQARLGRELTDSVLHTRMVPVATLIPRLERIVRQAARQTGHHAELEILGRDLSIDTDILTGLAEPLMHALRNAVDHGIETPAQRQALGKPETGRIRVCFRRDGNRIEVSCADDGRGLNYTAIERRARELGLLSAAEQQPTASSLASLIFLHGFSTSKEVNVISGRGVGMDVVRASIERLKGTTHIESREGAGCTLTFHLPLSLTTAHVLFVAVGEGTYGLPSSTVDQVLYSDAGRILQFGHQYVFEYDGRLSELHSLAGLLGQAERTLDDLERRPAPIVIANVGPDSIALVIDRALDSRRIVIKGLSSLLPTLPGVAGACVLPNGNVGVILELRELLRQPVAERHVSIHQTQATHRMPRALVVDDSLSARRALAQLLSDSGYEVATASDGLDAIASIDEHTPDVILADLEMPRMNGLELTSHLRSKPDLQSLPVVMITSRGGEKHRAQALRAGVTHYLTKPYAEHELLDCLNKLIVS